MVVENGSKIVMEVKQLVLLSVLSLPVSLLLVVLRSHCQAAPLWRSTLT